MQKVSGAFAGGLNLRRARRPETEPVDSITGYQWCDIEKCVKWMVPFAMVIRETGSSKLKQFRGVPAEDAHNIQTHLNSLDLLVSPLPVPARVPRAARTAAPSPRAGARGPRRTGQGVVVRRGCVSAPCGARFLDCAQLSLPTSPPQEDAHAGHA